MSRFDNILQCEEARNRFSQLLDTSSTIIDTSKEKENASKNGKRSKRKKAKHPKSDTIILVESVNSLTQFAGDISVNSVNKKIYLEFRGFSNVRNTCFLNVSLQMILHTPLLTGALNEYYDMYRSAIASTTTRMTDEQTILKNAPLLKQLLTLYGNFNLKSFSKGSVNKPCSRDDAASLTRNGEPPNHQFSSAIKPFSLGEPIRLSVQFAQILNLDLGYQEDAAECLTRLLSILHEELALLQHMPANVCSNLPVEDSTSNWIVTDRKGRHLPEARKTEIEGGPSIIKLLFAGTLVIRSSFVDPAHIHIDHVNSTTESLLRQNTNFATKEPFLILPIEIDHPKIDSIETALRFLAEPEAITDYRNVTDRFVPSMRRRAHLDQLPPYFILQLKRFSYVVKTNNGHSVNSTNVNGPASSQPSPLNCEIRKCLKLIQIPLNLIIPKELLSRETHFTKCERSYRLLAVIFHLGHSIASGHYTIAIRVVNTSVNSAANCDQFLYLDDTKACLVNDLFIDLLISSHRPLNVNTCSYDKLPKSQFCLNNRVDVSKQPRTPYILIYESLNT